MINYRTLFNTILPAVLLSLGLSHIACAITYKVEEITRQQLGNTIFNLSSSNNNDQFVFDATTFSDDKLFNNGSRAWLWKHGRMQPLSTLGTDGVGFARSILRFNDSGMLSGESNLFLKGVDQGSRAVVWREGRLRLLESGDFVASKSFGMNSKGEVMGVGRLVEKGVDKGSRAILWEKGKPINLGTLGVSRSGNAYSRALGLNNQAKVVGYSDVYNGSGESAGTHAFVWANGTMKDLGVLGVDPGFAFSLAFMVTDNNIIYGDSEIYDVAGNFMASHAFRWSDGVMQDLGVLGVDLGFSNATIFDVNVKQQITGVSDVYDSNGIWFGQHAFLWNKGIMQDLGVLGNDATGIGFIFPLDMNDKGQIVGFDASSADEVAFLYQNGAMTDLNSLLPVNSNLLLHFANFIDNQGRIVAFGTRTTAQESYSVYVLLTPVQK